jgi:putative ABC transport system permease protein
MKFALLMALRETRASWRRLLFFFGCVALGVATIVALRSVIQSVRAAIAGEARTLLAADVVIFTNRPWDAATRRVVDDRLADPAVLARTETIETATMARPAVETRPIARMVELRGVQEAFPFYGEVKLADGRRYSYDLLRGGGALVRPELLAQLDVRVGDEILLGGRRFRVRGTIVQEPGSRSGPFSLGSRILVSYDDLRATGLLTFGSRARYQILLRVHSEAQAAGLVERLRSDVADRFVSVRWYRATEEDIGEELERAENYLSLVGLAMVVLGGVGVWSVTRVFIQQKLPSIAVLKCLGASSRQVLATYLVQVALLALAGSVCGVGLAAIAIAAIPGSLAAALGAASYGLTLSASAQGIAVGLLVSFLFALVPLLEVRRVKPLLVLRQGAPGGTSLEARLGCGTRRPLGRGTRLQPRLLLSRVDWVRLAAALAVSAALAAVAGWQAGSARVGAIVVLGLAGIGLLLTAAGAGLTRAVAPLGWSRRFAVRHAVVNLRRPGNQTRVILLAVGLGAFFVIGVRVVQTNLLNEIAIELDEDSPDLFLIDIQQDQIEGVRRLVTERAGAPPKLVPVLRARVTGVRGRAVNLDSFEDVRGRGSLAREYVITYREALERNETLLDGALWSRDIDGPQVSIEEGIRERFRIQVGDMVRFDVLGRIVQARVTSVRRVNWDDARSGGFMFVFNPPTFATAPHGYLGFLKAPRERDRRARLQRDLVAAHPNVSAIDILEILERARAIIDNVSLAVSIVGLVALVGGAMILAGAVAVTRFQRIYEAAILRTLGATTRTLAAMLAFEYGLLGLLAGLIGSAGAAALGWAVARYLLEIAWAPAPAVNVAGLAITATLVGVVGVVASLEVLRRKPLATLRAE